MNKRSHTSFFSTTPLHTVFQLRGGHCSLPLRYSRPSEIFVASAYVSGDVLMCSWAI